MPTDSRPPNEPNQAKPNEHPLNGFLGFKLDEHKESLEFTKLAKLVHEIRKALTSSAAATTGAAGTDGEINSAGPTPTSTSTTTTSTGDSKEKNHKRAVEMLETDVKYIKDNLESLQSSPNSKRADVLLLFLMEATKRRTFEDFTGNEVNLKKLLQIIAKLKLWVPPLPPKEDEDGKVSTSRKKKKEEAPFVSRKEKDKAATEIVEELFGLSCKQWGMDGLLNSYSELNNSEKLSLLCFSGFKCQVDKVNDDGDMISNSLKIKKSILIHWWVAEGLIELHRTEMTKVDPQHPARDWKVEEVGESILKVLRDKGFIEPVMKKAMVSSRVTMHPFVHSFVTALAKRAGFFDISSKDGKMTHNFGLSQRACLVKSADKLSSCKQWEAFTDDRNKLKRFGAVQTLFNVNEPIIDIKTEWFSRMTNLVVLHLGSWKSEAEAVEHIEVEDIKFLEDLKLMDKLKLFSLQGVSTIMKLPDSVCKLQSLVILDLRECHNLEELPVEIGSLRSLTHLDITNCHLLTKLPKGISLLSNLEVLKGFVIYGQASDTKEAKNRALSRRCWKKAKGCVIHDVFRLKNKEVCALTDLGKLTKLRQLSLVVNINEFPRPEEVEVFKNMEHLTKLKISWEKSFEDKNKKTHQEDTKASKEESSGKCGWCFSAGKKADNANPSTREVAQNPDAQQGSSFSGCFKIKKLELWCYPHNEAPKWLQPNQLNALEKLYIKGGELDKVTGEIGTENKTPWTTVTTLRLKYLPNLEITWLELNAMFPKMKYLEKFDCKKLEYFPCDQEGVWQK